MTAIAASPQIRVRPLIDSRPPDVTWLRSDLGLARSAQPRLDLAEPSAPDPTTAPATGARAPAISKITVVRAKWATPPRPDLPAAAEWAATLALAVVQAMLAQRPIAQLNRWLAEEVLAEVSRQGRRRRSAGDRRAVPVTLRSVRVQHPDPAVAEVSVHVMVGQRSEAVALRLEAVGKGATGTRWLCTALEFAPQLRP